MHLLDEISELLQKGDDKKVHELTKQAIDQGMPPKEILDRGLISGMNITGEQFARQEIFLPEVLLAVRAMYAGLDLLKPLFIKDEMPSLGRVVIGTVQGDLHDIGKNLVGIMLKGAGFDVIDLGKGVSAQAFVETAEQKNANVIGMSTLLTTTMPVMGQVVNLLKGKNLQGTIKTIVGGAPASDDFAREIGADAYAYDAVKAVERVKQLVAES